MKFDYYLQRKYLQIYLSSVQHRQASNSVWNCRCPVCGDSQKDQKKMRGYFFLYKNDIVYKCHNCEYSAYLPSFLKNEANYLFKDMVMEAIGGEKQNDIVIPRPEFKAPNEIRLNPIKEGSAAWQYLAGRKLEFAAHRFRDVPNILDISRQIEKYKDRQWSFPAIGIPYIVDGRLVLLQCRSILEKRFASMQIAEDHIKIFGVDDVDASKPVSVLEGAFDSCFVNNAVACGGVPDHNIAEYLKGRGFSLRFIYDADYKTNKSIRKQLNARIDEGHSVVLFDRHFAVKDMNDAILEGWSIDALNEYLDSRTFSGAKAKLALTMS